MPVVWGGRWRKEGHRCVNVEKLVVKPLPLSSTPSEDTDSLIPVLATEHLISQQLADFSRSRFDGFEIGPELLPLSQLGSRKYPLSPARSA